MVDVTLPRQGRSFPLERIAVLLSAFLIALSALNWSAVMDKTGQNKCDSMVGKLSTQLKLDFYFSHCECMKHSFDFSHPCNSGYMAIAVI